MLTGFGDLMGAKGEALTEAILKVRGAEGFPLS